MPFWGSFLSSFSEDKEGELAFGMVWYLPTKKKLRNEKIKKSKVKSKMISYIIMSCIINKGVRVWASVDCIQNIKNKTKENTGNSSLNYTFIENIHRIH